MVWEVWLVCVLKMVGLVRVVWVDGVVSAVRVQIRKWMEKKEEEMTK